MWLKSLSMPWLKSLSIVHNILQPINCMWLKSLSMPWLKSLSIAVNTMDRDLSHDSCLNPCLCNVWVENYVYQ